MPGERVATRIITADSVAVSPETEVLSVTGMLTKGRVYKIAFFGHLGSTVATDDATARIRLNDNLTGIELQVDRTDVANSATGGRISYMEIEWIPIVSGFQTFVVTLVRTAGTGNVFIEAASNRPAYFTIDYIRG